MNTKHQPPPVARAFHDSPPKLTITELFYCILAAIAIYGTALLLFMPAVRYYDPEPRLFMRLVEARGLDPCVPEPEVRPPPHLQAGRGGRDHAGDLHRGRGHDAAGLVPRHHPGLGQRATVLHRRQEPAGAEETQRGDLGGHGGGVRYEGGVAEHDTRRNPRSRAGRVRRGREPSWIRSPPLQNVLVWRADGTAASVPLSEKATGGRVVKIPDVFYFPGV